MLKVLHGTIDANKEHLLLRVWEVFTEEFLGVSLTPVMVCIGWQEHFSPGHVNAQPKGGY